MTIIASARLRLLQSQMVIMIFEVFLGVTLNFEIEFENLDYELNLIKLI